MLIDSHMRMQLMELRIQEQIDAAERGRVLRVARPRRAWRIAALRLAAKSLRVEREIDFEVARAGSGR
ncbi:MAG TPA: hypothetical protein VGF46_08345 [Gaiellales bacterium]|jgi:hypothetical protein